MTNLNGWVEADASINGVPLNFGQSMTLRVAVEHFISYLANEGLGEDQSGKAMTKLYLARAHEIRAAILLNEPPEE